MLGRPVPHLRVAGLARRVGATRAAAAAATHALIKDPTSLSRSRTAFRRRDASRCRRAPATSAQRIRRAGSARCHRRADWINFFRSPMSRYGGRASTDDMTSAYPSSRLISVLFVRRVQLFSFVWVTHGSWNLSTNGENTVILENCHLRSRRPLSNTFSRP